jgi:hypothetical protein
LPGLTKEIYSFFYNQPPTIVTATYPIATATDATAITIAAIAIISAIIAITSATSTVTLSHQRRHLSRHLSQKSHYFMYVLIF